MQLPVLVGLQSFFTVIWKPENVACLSLSLESSTTLCCTLHWPMRVHLHFERIVLICKLNLIYWYQLQILDSVLLVYFEAIGIFNWVFNSSYQSEIMTDSSLLLKLSLCYNRVKTKRKLWFRKILKYLAIFTMIWSTFINSQLIKNRIVANFWLQIVL